MGRLQAKTYQGKKVHGKAGENRQLKRHQQSETKVEYPSAGLEYMITLQHRTEISVYGRRTLELVEQGPLKISSSIKATRTQAKKKPVKK